MYLAHWRISRIASMLVSGNAALHANSDRHFIASWNESMTARKYLSKMLAVNTPVQHNLAHITMPTTTTTTRRRLGSVMVRTSNSHQPLWVNHLDM